MTCSGSYFITLDSVQLLSLRQWLYFNNNNTNDSDSDKNMNIIHALIESL